MERYKDCLCVYVKNSQIDVSRFDNAIEEFLRQLDAELCEISIPLVNTGKEALSVVITSGYRQDKRNGKLTGSLHNYGKAVDLSIFNKDRVQVHEHWTKSNWTILKSVIQSLNEKVKGKGVYQVIFESTNQADVSEAKKAKEEIGSDSNFKIISKVSEFYTAPHFHIQYKEGRGGAAKTTKTTKTTKTKKSLPKITVDIVSLPDEIVDDPGLTLDQMPVQLAHLKFFYDGPNIRLFDLIGSHPVFRYYLEENGDLIEDRIENFLAYCGTENSGKSNLEIQKLLWTPTGSNICKVRLGQTEEKLTQEELLKKYFSDNNILIKSGSLLMLPPEDSNFLTTLALENGVRNQVSYFENFPAFISEKRKIMESDPGYVPSSLKDNVEHIFPNFTVWAFSFSKKGIVNITNYCRNIIVTTPINGFNSLTVNLSFVDNNFEKDSSRVVGDLNGPSLFSQILSVQSLIWVRFESLDCEIWKSSENTPSNIKDISMVPTSELPNKYYDFIGFVDNIYEPSNFSTSTFNVTLTAFSLDWALELDKAIFMPLSIITNDNGNGNLSFSSSNNKLMKRLSSKGEFLQLSQKTLYTFEEVIKFYLGQVIQIGFLDEDIFVDYGDRRSTLFEYSLNTSGNTIKEEYAEGIYQIFKVEIDEALKGRYFSDRNVFCPNGSVYSLIKSVCVPPLVEVFSDVYGDTYHLIIRRPPFDYQSIKSYLDEIESNPKGFNTILDSDVYSTELKWEDNFYTWFQITPEGSTPSVGEYINLLFQIVFVNEYVDTWGSRGLQFSDPYLRDIEIDQNDNFSETKAQIISDFIYVLESHLYLPFTRKGRIILNKGDRRIKKGTWVKLESTDELFYVERVDQKVSISGQSISRQTILTVSRGLRIGFIKPPQKVYAGEYISFSYFNIVDLESLKGDLIDYLNNPDKNIDAVLKNTLFVNRSIFDFFKEKGQFRSTGGGTIYY